MTDPAPRHLEWPFFDAAHRALAEQVRAWARKSSDGDPDPDDVAHAARAAVASLGEGGWLRHCVALDPGARWDVRALCLIREALAERSPILDFAFALQGLGSGPISLRGTVEQRAAYLPGIAGGSRLAAFALSEPGAGSDVGAIETRADRSGGAWVLNGTKTWISNAGIADQYVVFARSGEPGTRGLSAFIVDAAAPGLRAGPPITVLSPHPLGTISLSEVRVGDDRLLGEPGDGYAIAMSTLDVFRTTVGAAALGFARRALAEALVRARVRVAFGRAIADHQLIRGSLADMAMDVDAAALLVYRAAWRVDRGDSETKRDVSMAKLYATEAAQRVVDAAVQICGATGLVRGAPVEVLYRAVRALRIYEGTSEIQRLIIAERLLRESGEES